MLRFSVRGLIGRGRSFQQMVEGFDCGAHPLGHGFGVVLQRGLGGTVAQMRLHVLDGGETLQRQGGCTPLHSR